ncbi:MAG: PAS domain-containing sensor histidine kinase [Rhodospirillaceae bacterium]|nr:MAG: PAS domain-containing sensor histidine kinase [Rhodospirillaceae bacterium]
MTTTMAGPEKHQRQKLLHRLVDWADRINLERNVAYLLMVIGLACGIATYLIMADYWRTQSPARAISYLLMGDLVVVLCLGTIIARRVVQLWLSHRRGLVGAKLHSRLVLLFGLVALTPTIIVSVFSTTFLNYGLNVWFGDRVRSAVESSQNVTQSYLLEQQQRISNDALSMANEIRLQDFLNIIDPDRGQLFLDRQIDLRDISEAVIVTSSRRIVARSSLSLMMEFDLGIPDGAFMRARNGKPIILPAEEGDRIRALVQIDPTSDLFLYVGRLIDDRVLSSVRRNEDAVQLYNQLERARSQWQITVPLIFGIMALLLLTGAVWVAILSASQLVRPITRLVVAAQKIGDGDLAARVKVGKRDDELNSLSRTFNVMAIQLQTQQQALIAANRQAEDRRQFTELVLSGVSAGVIGLNEQGEIDLPNRSASELLGINLLDYRGRDLGDVVPEMAEIVDQARLRQSGSAEGQINLAVDTTTRTFHVRVISEEGGDGHTRLVVTFDDVSELLSAQRKAAWADIARRIAHEIKNPLTPIQLSAERLKRKYLKQITQDPETFTVCTDTIVRQVGDIGRMVDEFSAFARMPAPVLRAENIIDLSRQALFLQQNANPAISYTSDLPNLPVVQNCDSAQFNRALTNLLQNAADAIEGRLEEQRQAIADGQLDVSPPGHIHLWIRDTGSGIAVGVEDNGRGLPKQGRERLTEPYVTTRTKGTGLGLAIVKKIMEDHGGKLILADRDGNGASVQLLFPSDTTVSDRTVRAVQA